MYAGGGKGSLPTEGEGVRSQSDPVLLFMRKRDEEDTKSIKQRYSTRVAYPNFGHPTQTWGIYLSISCKIVLQQL